VDKIEFNLASVLGQESTVNLSTTTDADGDGLLSDEASKTHTTVISYFDRETIIADIAWTKSGLGRDDGDDLLEAGEKLHIVVNLAALTTGAISNALVAYDTFTIEVKPSTGAPVAFQKTIPQITSSVMTLK
jgi:archaellin